MMVLTVLLRATIASVIRSTMVDMRVGLSRLTHLFMAPA